MCVTALNEGWETTLVEDLIDLFRYLLNERDIITELTEPSTYTHTGGGFHPHKYKK